MPFLLTFSHVGVFATQESMVYLGVTPTIALLHLQQNFVRRMSPVISDVWAYFSEDTWVPHCTLVQYVPITDFGAVIEGMRTLSLPMTAQVGSISVIKITANGPQLIERLRLGEV